MKTIVLDSSRIERIITRIAYQTIESCSESSSLTIVGVEPRGIWVAEQIVAELKKHSSLKCQLISINPNDMDAMRDFEGRVVLLVDDIVNSGVTMMKVASHITSSGASHIMTACLVDRKHRKFPIKSDFTGLSLATTLKENLRLSLGKKPEITLE